MLFPITIPNCYVIIKIFLGDVNPYMSKLYTIFFLLITLFSPVLSEGRTITGPKVRLANNDIFVSFSLNLEDKTIQEIKNGIDKELKLYVDLFRIWKIWPNEFVLGKLYIRTLKADPVKKEYVSTSSEGGTLVERRFKSFESMISWALSVQDMKLTNTREIDPGEYFIRVTIESRIRKLPPVIGYLFIFLSENEFKIVKDSGIFVIEGTK
ncbi:MAG: hypothetical protein CVV37_06655 [Nitrospira bacterium HGW-Nitrospira-1]|nr:MAG: hypothetical protein CVV37_06655 [Nitrospira bacterium HGW-Nitrospira-1]